MMKSFLKVMLGMAVIPSLFTAVNANEINLLGDFSVIDASDSVSGNTLCDENADTSWKVENRFDYDIYSNIMLDVPKNSSTIKFSHSGAQWARPMLFDGIGDSAEGKQYENAWYDAPRAEDRWIEIQLPKQELANNLLITSGMMYSSSGQINNFKLQYKDSAGVWCDAHTASANGAKTVTASFNTVKSDCFRFYFPTQEAVRIRELSLSYIKDASLDYDVSKNALYLADESKIKVSAGEIPSKSALADGKRESADGNGSTKWFVSSPYTTTYIEYDLGFNHAFDTLRVTSGYNSGVQCLNSYYLMYYDGSVWKKVEESKVSGNTKKISSVSFKEVTASKIRLATDAKEGFRIQEIELFKAETEESTFIPANPAYIEFKTDNSLNTILLEGVGIGNAELYIKANDADEYTKLDITRKTIEDGFTAYSFNEVQPGYMKIVFGCDNFAVSEIKGYNTENIVFKSNSQAACDGITDVYTDESIFEFNLPVGKAFDCVDIYYDEKTAHAVPDACISAGTDGIYTAYQPLSETSDNGCIHIETGVISADTLKVFTNGMKVSEIRAYLSGNAQTAKKADAGLFKGFFNEYPQGLNIQPEIEFTATPTESFSVVPLVNFVAKTCGTSTVVSFPEGLEGDTLYSIYQGTVKVGEFSTHPMIEAKEKSLTTANGNAAFGIVPGETYTFKTTLTNNGRYTKNKKSGRVYFVLTEKENGKITALDFEDFTLPYFSEKEITMSLKAPDNSCDFAVYVWDGDNSPYTEKLSFENLYSAEERAYSYFGADETRYTVTAGNKEYEVKSADEADFVHIVSDDECAVRVEYNGKISEAVIRPLSKNVEFTKSESSISFNISPGSYYSVEINGDITRPLLVFCDKKQPVPEGDTIIFKGGRMYEIGDLKIGSGQNIYIEENAVVRGTITAENADGIKITGNGMLIAENFDNCISVLRSKNIELSGITAMNNGDWGTIFTDSENITIDNYKLIGYGMYSDGIDLVNCVSVGIDNAFIKNNDDSICIKLHEGYTHTGASDIAVTNSTIWSGEHGNSLEIGYELNGDYVKNVTYKNIDVIHRESSDYTFRRAAIAIHHAGRAAVSDITYDDIRVEETDEELVHIELIDHDQFGKCTGSVSGVKINNLTYLEEAARSTVRDSSAGGKGLEVAFKNLKIGEKTIGNLTEAKNNGFTVSGTNKVSFIK